MIENNFVETLFTSPVYYMSNATRFSHATWDKSDTTDIYDIGENDMKLLKKVGFHFNHSSVLEHSILIFKITMSTKALLEESRHRVGISQTVTSSRYTINKLDLFYESTDDAEIDEDIEYILKRANTHLKNGKPMDKVAMMLPQAYLYTLQITFNLRSLLHFLRLRLSKSAHYTIRKIAFFIIEDLKEANPDYFNLLMEDDQIVELYQKNKYKWYKDFENATNKSIRSE